MYTVVNSLCTVQEFRGPELKERKWYTEVHRKERMRRGEERERRWSEEEEERIQDCDR